MKYVVYKKWPSSLLPATIVWNLSVPLGIYVTTFDYQPEATIARILLIVGLIILDAFLLYMYLVLVSSVTFEKDAVRCSILNKTRRLIPYKEIKDYGIYWEKGVEFIYISKVTLSEFEKRKKAFDLYKKTKNVIIVQYDDEIVDFLREHVVLEK
jgi:hypothetical protein